MNGDIDRFVSNCFGCRLAKHFWDKTLRLLHSLPISERVWQQLVVDFKKFPLDKRKSTKALIIINSLTKRLWTIFCKRKKAKKMADVYYWKPFWVYGFSDVIVSDWRPKFANDFIDELCKITKIKWKLSSAGHSQTAGQAKVMNQYIDQRLCPYINHYQNNWTDFIPAIDFAAALLPFEFIEMSLYEVKWGYKANIFFD